MRKNGLFITFEGVDGCGKTTQLNLLHDFLTSKGYEVVLTREPGGNHQLGQQIRNILLHAKCEVDSKAEMFLFLADRAQHIGKFVLPSLKEGKIVLCDRHTDSTLAYQGYGRGQSLDEIICLNNIATNNIKPDLTLLYDIDIETSNARVGKEKDRMESAGNEFLKKVRLGYLTIAKNNPERIKVINATNSIEMVFETTKKYAEDVLKKLEENA